MSQTKTNAGDLLNITPRSTAWDTYNFVGDSYCDDKGTYWRCTVEGNPGLWVPMSSEYEINNGYGASLSKANDHWYWNNYNTPRDIVITLPGTNVPEGMTAGAAVIGTDGYFIKFQISSGILYYGDQSATTYIRSNAPGSSVTVKGYANGSIWIATQFTGTWRLDE